MIKQYVIDERFINGMSYRQIKMILKWFEYLIEYLKNDGFIYFKVIEYDVREIKLKVVTDNIIMNEYMLYIPQRYETECINSSEINMTEMQWNELVSSKLFEDKIREYVINEIQSYYQQIYDRFIILNKKAKKNNEIYMACISVFIGIVMVGMLAVGIINVINGNVTDIGLYPIN